MDHESPLRDEPDCIAARQQLENLEQINGEPVMEEAKRPYTMALNQICEDYDLKARTLFGKVYPNRETVQDVLEIYNDMKRRLDNNPSPQQCANIRYRLEALDLAEEEKVKVRKLIFECENKKRAPFLRGGQQRLDSGQHPISARHGAVDQSADFRRQ